MNQYSNNPNWERIRHLADGIWDSAAELIQNYKADDQQPADLRPLIDWLLESESNRLLFDQTREFDRGLQNALAGVPQPSENWEQQLKQTISQADRPVPSTGYSDQISTEDYKEADLADQFITELFSENDRSTDSEVAGSEFDDAINLTQTSDTATGIVSDRSEKSERLTNVGRRSALKWWLTSAASLLAVAASVAWLLFFRPVTPDATTARTAEGLCRASLDWKPNSVEQASWNSMEIDPPENRAFPRHLIRLQPTSWKLILIEGDQQGVVYRLGSSNDSADQQAYLYVFRANEDIDLPGQFNSYSLANRDYKLWSIACQQDLVFVLVYEGEEKRLQQLVKIQQVG